MAKRSIQWSPIGLFMRVSGAILIDRGNNQKAVASVKAAGETMKKHKLSLWMFPEGTRTLKPLDNTGMLPLKKGGFHLALQAEIPIIPIVVENYYWLYRKGHFGTGHIRVKGELFFCELSRLSLFGSSRVSRYILTSR